MLTDRVSELLDCPQPLYVDGQSKRCCESPPVHRSLLARLVCLFVVVVGFFLFSKSMELETEKKHYIRLHIENQNMRMKKEEDEV